MTDIRRYETTGRPVFITAVCHRRQPYLQEDWQKELLLSVMREVKAASGFAMHAWVILDDHFHWLIRPRNSNFSSVMHSIKLRYVHHYKKQAGKTEKTTLWQRRFWDHIIRTRNDMNRHLDYIHYNPVRHEYVLKPADYGWSSFKTHLERGNYDSQWGVSSIPGTIGSMGLE